MIFSTFVEWLKKSWDDKTSDQNIIQILFDSAATDDEYDGFNVSKSTASKLVNREENVRIEVRKSIQKTEISSKLPDYFKTKVIPKLMPLFKPELIHQLRLIIFSDGLISSVWKEDFISLAEETTLAEFLSDIFIYVVCRQNVKDKDSKEQLAEPDYTKLKLAILPVPEEVEADELPYVTALMDAYSEEAKDTHISTDNLDEHPDYKNDFVRRRKSFWLAESVKRGNRDLFGPKDPDQFCVLEDEVLNGVIDTYEEKYAPPSGMNRLRNVMKMAALVPVDKCWLARETSWVGVQEKQGICHVLVNEECLNGWVSNNG